MNRKIIHPPSTTTKHQPHFGEKPEPEGIMGTGRNAERDNRIWKASQTKDVLDIAREERIPVSKVRAICERMKRKLEPVKERDPEMDARDEIIRERFAGGETLEALGEEYHLTKQAMSLICTGVKRTAGRLTGKQKEERDSKRRKAAEMEKQKRIAAKEERDARIRDDYPEMTQKELGRKRGTEPDVD